MIQIKQLVTGPVEANCYFIYNETSLLIVDPGEDGGKIKEMIANLNRKPVAILLTHTHYDHIGALEEIRSTYDIPVYVHPSEQGWLTDPNLNLSGLRPMDMIVCEPAEFEFELKEYTLGEMTFEVRHTPGHSQGGVSFVFPEARFVVTGDALFAGSVGRSDLPTGDSRVLIHGIREQLFTLPENYKIYPGHRGSSTIGFEKKHNPFFQ
ncbi:MBL fold metallo-hydrolase [Vagococcus elongatus]|uniref:MBL fold metallo-hydrolase n=1 Tax=Vagococcus elongatus TaxID=180344 RepID=A0A430ANX7_9ENTE|nr:MBL fold metallo-hydrolase [Vagococcus elongatus]RSU09821.1 MBL fold metallo-hydrolase [Vagococcus elongatus]